MFNNIICIIESILLSLFVFKMHNLKNKQLFILLTTILSTVEIVALNNNLIQNTLIITTPLILTMFQYLIIRKKGIYLLLISLLDMLIITFSNMLALFIFSNILKLDVSIYLEAAIIISKIFAFILILIVSKLINANTLNIKKLSSLNILVIIYIIILDLQTVSRITNIQSYNDLITILTTIAIFMIYSFIQKVIENNKNELELYKNKIDKNYQIIVDKGVRDMKQSEHNIKLLLSKILALAENGNIGEIVDLVNKELGANKAGVLATSNNYFNVKFNELLKRYDYLQVNSIISFLDNSKMEDIEVVDELIKEINYILQTAKTSINIKIIEYDKVIVLKFYLELDEIDLKNLGSRVNVKKINDKNLTELTFFHKFKVIGA